ncbi:glycosyltransferase family A protein [Phascolarctobacterium sp.]|uniref:glycosyltransferase family A protein n=1 Tax=Phascolarctobacterium sp. TaxID=2049039 RepID=UPI0030771433
MHSLEILLSCMYEKDYSIIEASNIKTNAVIINQCDRNSKHTINLTGCKYASWINSTERGLSKSRNMAIKNSQADICLLADNDEFFDDDCETKILAAYAELPDADIIIFNLSNKSTKLKSHSYRLKRLELLRVCSWQITFKRQAIVDNELAFDIKLGAGSGNGAGEENKFLLDCYDQGLKIYHVPLNIAMMKDNESTWFTGYDEEFFYKRGMSTRYILGFWWSCVYGIYYVILKYDLYENKISAFKAFQRLFCGILENNLGKDYLKIESGKKDDT